MIMNFVAWTEMSRQESLKNQKKERREKGRSTDVSKDLAQGGKRFEGKYPRILVKNG
jgi:hypothetical protein